MRATAPGEPAVHILLVCATDSGSNCAGGQREEHSTMLTTGLDHIRSRPKNPGKRPANPREKVLTNGVSASAPVAKVGAVRTCPQLDTACPQLQPLVTP
jgi:hypothetical protein